MKYFSIPLFCIMFLFTGNIFPQTLCINEFMASNQSTVKDTDYNSYSDWIELYNYGAQQINLSGYSITDEIDKPQKYVLGSNAIIRPNEHLIIWADDNGTGLHANFKLSASGEAIALFSPSGVLVDSVTFGAQQTDISCGRYPDGSSDWFLFRPSTPGSVNLESGIYNRLQVPAVSHSGGFYKAPFQLTVTQSTADVLIYYTTDGKIPTENDNIYKNPIHIDSTSIVRLRTFKNGFLPSETVTLSYFINEKSTLPVFSLVTDPVNFFSDTSGIYVAGTRGITANCSTEPRNWNQDWERPADLQLFDADRTKGFHVNTGVKIYGGCSRLYAMKSLAFYFRDIYGLGKLQYSLFPDLNLTEYNNFLLRSSSQDWWRTMFRDGMVQTLIKQGMKIAYLEYRPSILFINGQYWGIHNIREKINEHYLNEHYGVDESNIDLIEISKNAEANLGDATAYNSMVSYLTNNSLASSANYEHIKSIVDVDDYIDYQLAEIYGANGDWPGSNMKLWRERKSTGKWRWLVYDLDFTFGGNAQGMANINTLAQATATNGPSWPNPPWATLMLRRMLENAEFKNEFIQRMAVHINTTFEPAHVNKVIDSLGAVIASEIQRHKQRWVQSISMGNDWNANVQVMKTFANDRPAYIRSFFNSQFSLNGNYSLTISKSNNSRGKIFLHNSEWTRNGEAGIFFKNIPLKIKAVALPGYKFTRWSGASSSTSPEIVLSLSGNAYLNAIFEPEKLKVTSIVINEINYKSSGLFDTEDWVELYNPSDSAADISAWKLMSSSNSQYYQFPANTSVAGKQYLVVCRDTAKFKALQSKVTNAIGNIPFGLSSDGEGIKLVSAKDSLIDEVNYLSSGAWTPVPNGTGATLALINPQFDNSLAENWTASASYGTPGKLNDVYVTNVENTKAVPELYLLCNNYPNPFNPATTINYSIPNFSNSAEVNVSLKIYDIIGREVAVLVNKPQRAGTYEVMFDGAKLSSGIYLYRLQANRLSVSGKMMLLK